MAAGEYASLPRELRWMRRVIDHPVSHAVVYSCCGGLSMLHDGLALGILGRRAGGAAGARLADAGNSAAFIGICTLLFSPVALYLFGLRAAVAAMESDEGNCLGSVRTPRYRLQTRLVASFSVRIAGLWVQRSTSGNGCFAEFGSLVFDVSVISIAVIHWFVVCPRWIHEWRAGQKSCESLKR